MVVLKIESIHSSYLENIGEENPQGYFSFMHLSHFISFPGSALFLDFKRNQTTTDRVKDKAAKGII